MKDKGKNKFTGFRHSTVSFCVSLRNCHDEVVSSFEPVSHEAIRLWYHKTEGLFSVEKAFRCVIAIDETKVKINGKWHILWVAIDVDTWEVLCVWITQGRASFEVYGFIRYVLTKCENNSKLLVDGGPWYKPALKRRGGRLGACDIRPKESPIEQWFGILKHRINLFYNRWLHNASIESAQTWINAFVSMYHMRRC